MERTAAPTGRPRWETHVAALAAYGLLAMVLFHRSYLHAASDVPGAPGDSAQAMWFLSWLVYAVTHLQNPLVTNWAIYPHGANLMWTPSIVFPAALLAPVTAVAGPIVAYNLMHFAAFVLSGWLAAVATRRLSGNNLGALLGGALYAFSPFMIDHGGGHAQLFIALYPPVVLLLLHEVVSGRRSPRAVGVLLGLATAAQLMTGEELVVIAALTAGVGLAVAAALAPAAARAKFVPLVVAVGWALCVFLPLVAFPLAVQFLGPQRPTGVLHTDILLHHNDLLTLVVPKREQAIGPGPLKGIADAIRTGGEQSGYLGVGLLGLLLVGAAGLRRRPLEAWAALAGLAMFLLSLGGHLYVLGRATGIPLPWLVMERVPLLNNTLVSRLSMTGYLFAGIAVAAVVARMSRGDRAPRPYQVALGLLTAALLFPTLNYVHTPQQVPPFFRGGDVQRLRERDVAVIVPFINEAPKTMLWQAVSQFRYKMPSGYLFVPGPDYPLLFPPPSPLRDALSEVESGRPKPSLDHASRAGFARDMVRWQARTFIVGPMTNQDRTIAFVSELLRRPPVEDGGVYVWWNVTAEEVR